LSEFPEWNLRWNDGKFYCVTTFIDGKVKNKDILVDTYYLILPDGGLQYTNKYAKFTSYVYIETVQGVKQPRIKIKKCNGKDEARFYFEPKKE
jgi:hypothetical protein